MAAVIDIQYIIKLFDIESQSKLKNVKPSQKNQAWPQNSGQAKPKNQAKPKSQAKPKIKPSHKIKPSQVLKSSQAKLKVKHAWKINFVGFSLAWLDQVKPKSSQAKESSQLWPGLY